MAESLRPVAAEERIHALDLLRGWAMFGVLWSNLNDHYGVRDPGNGPDRALQWIQNNLIEERFYTLLVLLFGVGFGIQLTRAIAAGRDLRNTYYRRAAALLAIGIALTLYTSISLVRALRIAHVLAWEEPFRRPARLPRDGAIFSAALVGTIAIETGFTYLRHQDEALSLVLVPLSFAITGGVWLGLSCLLPHADANWRALLPGAALFATGHALLQVATVYYFAPKLSRAPALYGSLGSAATLLLWLYLISRIVVASAFLNAALWRRSGGASS